MSAEKSLRTRALECLARREHSRAELSAKLGPYAQSPEQISGLLDELERLGYLSEKRVVEQAIQGRRGKFGASRIVHELRRKGVAEDLIAEALPELKGSELEAAHGVWRRKFGRQPAGAQERARQMRFLQGRGFNLDVIMKVLRGDDDD